MAAGSVIFGVVQSASVDACLFEIVNLEVHNSPSSKIVLSRITALARSHLA